MKVRIKDLDALNDFAKKLMTVLPKGVVVALNGNLGLGKTTFVKLCAAHLGIQDTVDSPTFTILKTYENPTLHHIDAYRLEGSDNMFDIEEAVYDQDAYIFIEWAQYIATFLPENRIEISFQMESNQERVLDISSKGDFDVESLLSD